MDCVGHVSQTNCWNKMLVNTSLFSLLCTASILSLCAISIDRYLAITRPLAYSRRRRSKRLALSMISCVWVAATVITSPPIFGWYDETRNVENKCNYNENTGYVVYSALGSFFLPLLVMLYVYARIACVIARRQNSIQKLSNMSDKKTRCYAQSDPKEPLRHQKHFQETFEEDVAVDQKCQEEETDLQTSQNKVTGKQKPPKRRNIWGLFQIQSCYTGDEDSHSEIRVKRSSSDDRKSVEISSESDSNSGSNGLDMSLPATLSGCVEPLDTFQRPKSKSTSPDSRKTSVNQQPEMQHPSTSRFMRTGSRLCHHSIANTSPQKNIHRLHQTNSSTRLFLENELVALEDSKSLRLSRSAPRVWTVEETSISTLSEDNMHSKSPKMRGTSSLKQEKLWRNMGGGRPPATSLLVPITNSPAGNPASLMSSPNISGGESSQQYRNSTPPRNTLNRIDYPQRQPQTPLQSSVMHRGRSIKLTLNHGNDDNQNGSTTARDFSSGRVASFKRETKTAQTLAAVVGGFIVCWLPFFVGYVIGPFVPPELISTSLMDFLIWLGWSNSTINPFIYAFYSPDFRSAFWRLTVKKCTTLVGYKDRGRSSRRFDDHVNVHSRIST